MHVGQQTSRGAELWRQAGRHRQAGITPHRDATAPVLTLADVSGAPRWGSISTYSAATGKAAAGRIPRWVAAPAVSTHWGALPFFQKAWLALPHTCGPHAPHIDASAAAANAAAWPAASGSAQGRHAAPCIRHRLCRMLQQQAGVGVHEDCLSPGQPEAVGIECRNPAAAAAAAAAIQCGSEPNGCGIGTAGSGILVRGVQRVCRQDGGRASVELVGTTIPCSTKQHQRQPALQHYCSCCARPACIPFAQRHHCLHIDARCSLLPEASQAAAAAGAGVAT